VINKATPTEAEEQATLFSWAAMRKAMYPELAYLFHIPNEGKRSYYTGAKMRAEGLKAGVPDLFLPAARGNKHGLFIELKRVGGKKPTAKQQAWLAALEAQGYATYTAYGWQQAAQIIIFYLEGHNEASSNIL